MLDNTTLYFKKITLKQIEFLEDKFDFDGNFSTKTGEEKPPETRRESKNDYVKTIWRIAIYKHLKIMIGRKINPLTKKCNHSLKVVGSIHKYARNGDNSGCFTTNDAVKALDDLCDELQIDKHQASINCLEVGVNIPFANALKFLDLYLVKRYKSEPFKHNSKYDHSGYTAYLTHYDFKIYAKEKDILRVEIRWNNLQELRQRYKLQTVADLTPELIDKIALETLTERLNDVVSLNGIDIVTKTTKRNDGMKLREQYLLTQFSCTEYLSQLEKRLKDCPKEKRNAIYQADRRARIKFENTLKKYQKMDFVKYLKDQIIKQVEKQKCQLFILGEGRPEAAKTGHSMCQSFNAGIKLKKLTHSNNAKHLINKLNSNSRMSRIRKAMEDRKELINKIKIGSRELVSPC